VDIAEEEEEEMKKIMSSFNFENFQSSESKTKSQGKSHGKKSNRQ